MNKKEKELIGALIGLAKACNVHLKTGNTDSIIIKICTPHYTSLAKYDVHYIFYLSVFFVKYRKSTLERV